MKRCLTIAPILVFALIVVHTSPAKAEFAVCNSTSYGTVSLAYAATWQDSQGSSYGESQGWWVIDENKCQIVITTVDVSAYTMYIYAFATNDPAHNFWGGTTNFCLDPKNKFLYHGNAMDPPCSSGKSFGMRLMSTSGASPYTYYLRD